LILDSKSDNENTSFNGEKLPQKPNDNE